MYLFVFYICTYIHIYIIVHIYILHANVHKKSKGDEVEDGALCKSQTSPCYHPCAWNVLTPKSTSSSVATVLTEKLKSLKCYFPMFSHWPKYVVIKNSPTLVLSAQDGEYIYCAYICVPLLVPKRSTVCKGHTGCQSWAHCFEYTRGCGYGISWCLCQP